MRALGLRITFAGLLVATTVHKVWLSRIESPDIRAAVIELVVRNGWSAHPAATSPGEPVASRINFRAAGCVSHGQIFVIGLDLQDAPMLDHVIEPGYARRFVYLGRTWLTQDRMGMRLEWIKQKMLSLFGAGRYIVNEAALVIAEPRDCESAGSVDWSQIWTRHTQQGPLPISAL